MHNLSIKQYLLRGGAWAFVGKVLTAIMGLVLSALLARLLSPEDMGSYFLAFNLATFFSIFARMGLEKTLLRFVAEALGDNQHYRARVVIQKGLYLALVSTVAVAILVYVGVGPLVTQYIFKSNILGGVIGLVAIWLMLLAFQLLLSEIFRAFQHIRMAVLFGGLFTSIVTVFFIAVYMFVKENLITLNLLLPWVLVAGGLNIIIAIWVLIIQLRSVQFSDKDKTIRYSELVNHSWPLLINAVMLFGMSQSSLWVVGAFRPEEDVAIYGAATRLVLLTGMALAIVNSVVPPLIARLNGQSEQKRLERILRATATIAAVPAFVVLSVFIFFGSWVLGTIFGEYYSSGCIVLLFLSIGQGVNVFVGSCGYALVLMGYQRTMMLISIMSAVIALCSGVLFVRSFGIAGVAAGYTFAMIVQQILILAFTRYRCGLWTHADLRYLYSSIRIIKEYLLR